MVEIWQDAVGLTIPVILVFGPISLYVMAHLRDIRKTVPHLRALAVHLGLSLQYVESKWVLFRNYPVVSGTYRGRQVRIWSVIAPIVSGQVYQRLTLVRATCANQNRLQFEVELVPRSGSKKVSDRSKPRLVSTGDKTFDEHWQVHGSDKLYLKASFTPEIRARFEDCRRMGLTKGGFSYDRGQIFYTEPGIFSSNPRAFAELVQLVCDLADIVDKYKRAGASESGQSEKV